jgi:hypothetical protein
MKTKPLRKLRLSILGLLFVFEVTPAQVIHKWRTPEGRVYFGDKPPAGSESLGVVGEIGIVSGGTTTSGAGPAADDEKAAAEAGVAIRAKRAADRQAEAERRQKLADAVRIATFVTTRGRFHWVVNGVVENSATESVHDVEVGCGGAWVKTEPSIIPAGGQATFRLEVEKFPLSESDELPPPQARWREQ